MNRMAVVLSMIVGAASSVRTVVINPTNTRALVLWTAASPSRL